MLTLAQITAIIMLLQAFNADPAVIANVQATLTATQPKQVVSVGAPVETPVLDEKSCGLTASTNKRDQNNNPYTARIRWTLTGESLNDVKLEVPKSFGGGTNWVIDGQTYYVNFDQMRNTQGKVTFSLATMATTTEYILPYYSFYKLSFPDGVYCIAKTQ